ncbi:MAG: DUF1501 domain-containing protein [Gemmataceae bacterium]|nr:DUF1501 domain-containing protein [Gemmataceae bacterium]
MSHALEHLRHARGMLDRRMLDRRSLLRVGGLGCLGLSLPRLLRAEAARPAGARIRSCILLYYYGGPSHLDTWDLKPAAPAEIRGEFRPIATRVPGFQVGEHLPRCARLTDKLAVIRSFHHPMRNHNSAAVESLCGRTMTPHHARAFDLLHSQEVRRAFDLARESEPARQRYGRHTLGQSLLLARRLVEAGVRFVNVNDKITNGQLANWDSHENNFPRLKDDLLPPADQAYSALIEDLDARGLLESTLVVTLAEFGRTPRINGSRGRDHWPDCFSVVLAGGGVRGGAIHGASDRFAAYPEVDPVSPGDLAATLFWRFGIDPHTEIRDLTARPYRVAEGQPLRRLFA